MIDIHCHIVPGVDDGAKTLDDALAMLKIAESEGIKKIINTSHYHPQFKYTKGEDLLVELENFNKIIKENGIDVEVIIGNELYFDDSFLECIEKKEFYTLNNSKYVLVEFSPTNFPKKLSEVVYEFKIRGYVPILAHVERYNDIQQNPSLITEAIKEGALIQINASSVLGKGSSEAHRITEILLKNSLVHFVATDAHGPERRRPMIREAYDYVCSEYGEKKAERLFINNASRVINNEEVEIEVEVNSVKNKKSFLSKFFKKSS